MIPVFASCVGAHTIIFIYYVYITLYRIKGDIPTFLYTNTLLHLVPFTVYSIMLFDFIKLGTIEQSLSLYCIEWLVTTPLLLVSLSSLKKVHIGYSYAFTLLTVLMNLTGYISLTYHSLHTILLTYLPFAVGCGLYILIIVLLVYVYRQSPNVIENSNQYLVLNNNIIYKNLMIITVSSWSFYPVVYALYITSFIDLITCIVCFAALDFISKGVFTFITFGYELYKQRADTSHTRLLHRVVRVYPLPLPSNEAEPGVADYTLSAIPVITDTESGFYEQPNRLTTSVEPHHSRVEQLTPSYGHNP